MATAGDHRLAAQVAMDAAEAFEQSRQDAHSPACGDEAGVLLSDADAGELAALGMSPGVEIPEHGDLRAQWEDRA